MKAQRTVIDPNAAYWAALDKKLGVDGKSAVTKERQSRWELGNWDYQGFNSNAFDRGWRRFESVVIKQCMKEEEDKRTFIKPTQVRFMRAVCMVLVRLERKGTFDILKRTRNFSTLAMDHEESEAAARARMKAIRRRLAGK